MKKIKRVWIRFSFMSKRVIILALLLIYSFKDETEGGFVYFTTIQG